MYSSGGQAGAYSSGRARAVERCAGVNSGLYNDNMTKTYEINVPSGKYAIERDNDSCVYDAYEYFIENVLTPDDIIDQRKIENFDVFEIITITVNE